MAENLTITVKDGSSTLVVSNSLKLWTNVIDATEPSIPSTSGTIYLYGLTTITNNIIINANKISVLINPSGIKSIRTTGACNSISESI